MNLVSCETCGVVLDKDKIRFPNIRNEDGSVILANSAWVKRGYTAVVPCPACGAPIPEHEELP